MEFVFCLVGNLCTISLRLVMTYVLFTCLMAFTYCCLKVKSTCDNTTKRIFNFQFLDFYLHDDAPEKQGCKLYSFMKDLQTFHYWGNDDLNEQTV